MLPQLKKYSPYLLLFLILFLVYIPAWVSQSAVDPDASIILPNLLEIKGLKDYLLQLAQFKTVDFQPVRDLSLSFDLMIWKMIGLRTFVLHNLLIWFVGSIFVKKLIEKEFPQLEQKEVLLILGCFLVYPLFVNSLSWGMARKHILAFLFCLVATNKWLTYLRAENLKTRYCGWITTAYLLSILSQPITLLWPFWALAQTTKEKFKNHLYMLIPCFIAAIIVGLVNYRYYTSSPVFLSTYDPKNDELFNFGDQLLALGHHAYSLILPYQLPFHSTLGDPSVMIGLIVLVLIFIVYWFVLRKSGFARRWGLFALFPILVIIQKPSYLYDTYLITSSLSVLFFFLILKDKFPTFPKKSLIYFGIITVFSLISFNGSSLWADKVSLHREGFFRRENCWNAAKLLINNFDHNSLEGTEEAKKYLYSHDCGRFEMSGPTMARLKAWLLYYDDSISWELRLKTLEELTPQLPIAEFMSAALMIKLNRQTQADERIQKLVVKYGNLRPQPISIVKYVIHPYCAKRGLRECEEKFAKLTVTSAF